MPALKKCINDYEGGCKKFLKIYIFEKIISDRALMALIYIIKPESSWDFVIKFIQCKKWNF